MPPATITHHHRHHNPAHVHAPLGLGWAAGTVLFPSSLCAASPCPSRVRVRVRVWWCLSPLCVRALRAIIIVTTTTTTTQAGRAAGCGGGGGRGAAAHPGGAALAAARAARLPRVVPASGPARDLVASPLHPPDVPLPPRARLLPAPVHQDLPRRALGTRLARRAALLRAPGGLDVPQPPPRNYRDRKSGLTEIYLRVVRPILILNYRDRKSGLTEIYLRVVRPISS
eukprot:COSAG01_NODE_3081_length_6620_cov_26.409230_2_plen_227_part_00